MSDPMTVIEIVAWAIEEARCFGREGPYGLYDYSNYTKENPHHVRDFRDLKSPTFGEHIFVTDNAELAKNRFEELTRAHIAQAAITAVFDAIAEPTPGMLNAPIAQPGTMADIWRAMLSARFAEILGDQK